MGGAHWLEPQGVSLNIIIHSTDSEGGNLMQVEEKEEVKKPTTTSRGRGSSRGKTRGSPSTPPTRRSTRNQPKVQEEHHSEEEDNLVRV